MMVLKHMKLTRWRNREHEVALENYREAALADEEANNGGSENKV